MSKKISTVVKGKKGQQLNKREIQLITRNQIKGILTFDMDLKKDSFIFDYKVDGLLPLDVFLCANILSRNDLISIFRYIITALNSLEEHRFSKDLIIWDIEAVHISPETLETYLMYVPLQFYETKGNLKEFLLNFIALCNFNQDEDLGYVQEIVRELNQSIAYSAYMLLNYCNKIADLHGVEKKDEAFYVNDEDIFKNENGVITKFKGNLKTNVTIYIENISNGQINYIERFPYRVGKSEQLNDCVLLSRVVSRKHAEIMREQGGYYIVDLGSTNGTYINKRRLQPGVKERLYDGMSIKVANEEFIFHCD